jgi:hypothetical protein
VLPRLTTRRPGTDPDWQPGCPLSTGNLQVVSNTYDYLNIEIVYQIRAPPEPHGPMEAYMYTHPEATLHASFVQSRAMVVRYNRQVVHM